MKGKYLEDLKKLLDDYQMDESERLDIINDYSEMYDSWGDKGLMDDEISKKLGHPRSIIRELTEGYKKVERPLPGSEKVISLSPFVATIAFLILGFGLDLWHPGWMVFLLIPVTAIIMGMGKTKNEHLTTALSPFVATTIFLLLGFVYDLWHPGWMVFLLTPVLGIWNSRYTMKRIDLFTALSPFIASIGYVVLGMYGYWVEGWVIFMLIPMLGIWHHKNKSMMIFWELLGILGIVGYLYIGTTYADSWQYAWLTFVPFIVVSFFNGDWEITIDKNNDYRLVIALSIAAFLLTGFFLDAWAVCWLFFLSIPVYSIIKETGPKERAVALTPFIAITIFMLVGYYADLWHLAWIVFIIIPMTAVIKHT